MTDTTKGSPAARIAVAAIGAVLLLDAAVETSIAGSAVRWWIISGALVYAAVTAALWRMRLGWQVQRAVAVVGVLGLVAATAWAPGGLTDGIRFFGQPTSRVMAALAAAGVAFAGLALVRVAKLPLAARLGVGAVAAYGVLAFLVGAIDSAPLPALLAGQSLWQRLPTVLQGAFVGAFVVLPIGLVWSIVKTGLRRPAELSLRAEAWKIVAVATSFAIVLAGLPLRSGAASTSRVDPGQPENYRALLGIDPNAPKPSQEALNTQLANSLRAIEDGEREMSRDHWDPGYVLAALEYDPQRLFTWVQQNTFWIPYHGLLRGSVGVLMDRLGNSLDRAVLLALLLRQSGRTVRLAHGSLSTDQAMTLLPPLLASRYARAARPIEPASNQLQAIAAQYQLDEQSIHRMIAAQSDFGTRKRAQLLAQLPEQTKRLTLAVGSGPNGLMGRAFDRAIDALKDHWWVQVQEGDAWQDFDLVNPSVGPALTNSDKTVDLDAFPSELRHQVTVRVIAEQWANGSLTERVALESILRPTQLIGTPIALRFLPARWPSKFPVENKSPEQSLRMLALDQHEWTPALIVGKDSTEQSTIRETGDLISADEARKASGGMAGGAISGLTKRLDDALGPSTPAPGAKPSVLTALTSASIEYEIQQPGERPQKIRRALFDLIGPAARAKKPVAAPKIDEIGSLTRSLALMRETEILPVVCRFSTEYVAHLGAETLLANRDILGAVVRGEGPGDFEHARDFANRLTPMPTPLYGLALARFDLSRFSDAIYVGRLNLLTRHTFFAPAAASLKMIAATDIVANDVDVDLAADNPFAVRLEQGVLDTNAEAVLASARPNASNAGSALASSGDWKTLRAPGDPQLGTLRLSDDVRKRIADDLAAGYVVVAPQAPVTIGTDAFSGWWRVSPATGETLGMGSTGWGQEMVEWLVVNALEQALLQFLLEFIACTMSSPLPIAAQGPGCVGQAAWAGVLAFLLSLIAGGLFIYLSDTGAGARGLSQFAKTEPDLGPTLPGKPGPPGGAPGGGAPGGGAPGGGAPGGGAPGGAGPGGPGPGGGPGPTSPFEEAWANNKAAAAKLNEVKAAAEKKYGFLSGDKSPEVQAAWKEVDETVKKLMDVMRGKRPPTGPGGTQIMTGPGGTKIIPTPGLSKTGAGIDGVLNALGQRGGG